MFNSSWSQSTAHVSRHLPYFKSRLASQNQVNLVYILKESFVSSHGDDGRPWMRIEQILHLCQRIALRVLLKKASAHLTTSPTNGGRRARVSHCRRCTKPFSRKAASFERALGRPGERSRLGLLVPKDSQRQRFSVSWRVHNFGLSGNFQYLADFPVSGGFSEIPVQWDQGPDAHPPHLGYVLVKPENVDIYPRPGRRFHSRLTLCLATRRCLRLL